MYSNIKWQSLTMQSHNYFCTNLIQNQFCWFVKSLFSFSISLILINYTYVNMYIYTYIIYLVNCSLRLFTNVLAKNNLKYFDYGKFQMYKSRQNSIINSFYPFPNFSFIFPDSSVGKESACNAGDLGSIPGLGRSPGEGKGYPLQYSGLENSMDCIIHGVAQSDVTKQLSHSHPSYFHFCLSHIILRQILEISFNV